MTVWVVSQPTRGQLLAKGAFRVAGTLVGACVGVALILALGGSVLAVMGGYFGPGDVQVNLFGVALAALAAEAVS